MQNKFKVFSAVKLWMLAVILTAVAVGCGTSEAPKPEAATPEAITPASTPDSTMPQPTDSLPVDSNATSRPDPRKT
ncbi:MAG: hypothetical protein EAY75_07305 [Bacteroidetes bacterium]|nr:MAG: hypothetical protein EAY75_07305 [Bacteroidota bacterium]